MRRTITDHPSLTSKTQSNDPVPAQSITYFRGLDFRMLFALHFSYTFLQTCVDLFVRQLIGLLMVAGSSNLPLVLDFQSRHARRLIILFLPHVVVNVLHLLCCHPV